MLVVTGWELGNILHSNCAISGVAWKPRFDVGVYAMRSGTTSETNARPVIFLDSKSFARGRRVMKRQTFTVAEETTQLALANDTSSILPFAV